MTESEIYRIYKHTFKESYEAIIEAKMLSNLYPELSGQWRFDREKFEQSCIEGIKHHIENYLKRR